MHPYNGLKHTIWPLGTGKTFFWPAMRFEVCTPDIHQKDQCKSKCAKAAYKMLVKLSPGGVEGRAELEKVRMRFLKIFFTR